MAALIVQTCASAEREKIDDGEKKDYRDEPHIALRSELLGSLIGMTTEGGFLHGCNVGCGRVDCALLRGTLRCGTWRSPVAHLNGVQGAAGSNPAVPIDLRSCSRTDCMNAASASCRGSVLFSNHVVITIPG